MLFFIAISILANLLELLVGLYAGQYFTAPVCIEELLPGTRIEELLPGLQAARQRIMQLGSTDQVHGCGPDSGPASEGAWQLPPLLNVWMYTCDSSLSSTPSSDSRMAYVDDLPKFTRSVAPT